MKGVYLEYIKECENPSIDINSAFILLGEWGKGKYFTFYNVFQFKGWLFLLLLFVSLNLYFW